MKVIVAKISVAFLKTKQNKTPRLLELSLLGDFPTLALRVKLQLFPLIKIEFPVDKGNKYTMHYLVRILGQ